MSDPIPLFEISNQIDRKELFRQFARDRRVQVRNVLTEQTAQEVHKILANFTPWGMSWQAGEQGPHHLRGDFKDQLQSIGAKLGTAMRRDEYAFCYSAYPIVDAYNGRWAPDGPHDLLLEHINDRPFMDLVREITGIPELIKADAQATLFGPGQFLSQHNDSHMAEGWRVAYVLNLTAGEWRPDWGGYLLFYDDAGDVIAGFKPRFNSLNLFAVPQWHSVSYVPPFSPVGRFAITGWFSDR